MVMLLWTAPAAELSAGLLTLAVSSCAKAVVQSSMQDLSNSTFAAHSAFCGINSLQQRFGIRTATRVPKCCCNLGAVTAGGGEEHQCVLFRWGGSVYDLVPERSFCCLPFMHMVPLCVERRDEHCKLHTEVRSQSTSVADTETKMLLALTSS